MTEDQIRDKIMGILDRHLDDPDYGDCLLVANDILDMIEHDLVFDFIPSGE